MALYPPLEDRKPVPAWLVPTSILLFIVTPIFSNVRVRIALILPLLISLAAITPFFTDGTAQGDYNWPVAPLLCALAVLDFYVVSPLLSEPVNYIGSPKGQGNHTSSMLTERYVPNKLRNSINLFCTGPLGRGIGWSLQVKGVPPHRYDMMPRAQFVGQCLLFAVQSALYKCFWLYLLGLSTAVKATSHNTAVQILCHVAMGWSGAFWAVNGINTIYRVVAAITVAIGLCDPWQWPPMFGNLRDAWSVRQMWSSVYHQLLRRTLQTPGRRLARLCRFAQGSTTSKYLQLFMAFGISALLHEWFAFNALRRDNGELWFFLTQPLAISFEDFVQYYWKARGPTHKQATTNIAVFVGYGWTFLWFSYSLPPFIENSVHAKIIGPDFGCFWAFDLAQRHSEALRLIELQE